MSYAVWMCVVCVSVADTREAFRFKNNLRINKKIGSGGLGYLQC